MGEHLNVMMQSLHTQDGTLPPGLTVQNVYTELRKGSKKAVVVVQNQNHLPTDPSEENSSGKNDTCTISARGP